MGILLAYLENVCQKVAFPLKRGAKHRYSRTSFVVMFLKKIHRFKSMHKYAQQHYQSFGWSSCPIRKTIRVSVETLPALLQSLIPELAKVFALKNKCFDFKWVFIDKSVFRSLGGIWHAKHMKAGLVLILPLILRHLGLRVIITDGDLATY